MDLSHLSLRFLFLDLNSYFASVEQQLNPELRGKPVAVVPLETDATCAIAASYEAKAYGVKTGTKIYDAKRLCPDLICIKADHEHYVRFHHKILAEIDRHVPVTQIASIDEMACELDETQRNKEAAVDLALRLKAGLAKNVGEYVKCSIGLAPNRFLAKVGTELQKPDGLVVIEAHQIPDILFSLELRDIPGIGKSMHHRLNKLGVFTIEQLCDIPPKHMRAIWHSVAGERMYYKLRGLEIADEATQKRSIGHSHVHGPENRPEHYARLVNHRLMLKAASRLRRDGYYATAMDISLRVEQGERYHSEVRFVPTQDTLSLTPLWNEQWNMMMHGIKAELRCNHLRIKKTSITFHGLETEPDTQPDLFNGTAQLHKREKNEKLSLAMDALNQRFGRNTITTAATLGEANKVTGTKIAFGRIPDAAEFRE